MKKLRAVYLFAAFSLSGCFLFAESKTSSTTIKIEPKSSSLELSVDSQLTLLSEDPYIYRLNSPELGTHYLTSIRECGEGINQANISSLSRALLVGFEKVKILNRRELLLKSVPALLSQAQGRLDDKDLNIVSLTTRDGECVIDYVLWHDKRLNTSLDALGTMLRDWLEKNGSLG